MTQIVVTLDKNADENFLRRMIENMRGVVKTSLKHTPSAPIKDEGSQFMDSLHSIKEAIDPSVIDFSDPRTKFILK